MPQMRTMIVGQYFRPPAKQVLAHLAQGAKLTLEREDDNPYDQLAVKVWVDPGLIPTELHPALDAELNNCGMTVEQLLSTGLVFLGYVPAQEGKPLAKARQAEPELTGNAAVRQVLEQPGFEATLAFGLDGSPRVTVSWEEATEAAAQGASSTAA